MTPGNDAGGRTRTALVTGGTGGMGRVIAAKLAADGFDVAVAYIGNDDVRPQPLPAQGIRRRRHGPSGRYGALRDRPGRLGPRRALQDSRPGQPVRGRRQLHALDRCREPHLHRERAARRRPHRRAHRNHPPSATSHRSYAVLARPLRGSWPCRRSKTTPCWETCTRPLW
jgi:hypothetical protein